MLLLPSFDSCRDRWCERERKGERNKVGQKQHENKDFSVEEKRKKGWRRWSIIIHTQSEIIMSCEICLASLLLCSIFLFFSLKLIDHQSDPLLFYRLRCYKNVLLLLHHTLDSLAVFDTNPMMVVASSFILGCLSRSPFSSHISSCLFYKNHLDLCWH